MLNLNQNQHVPLPHARHGLRPHHDLRLHHHDPHPHPPNHLFRGSGARGLLFDSLSNFCSNRWPPEGKHTRPQIESLLKKPRTGDNK